MSKTCTKCETVKPASEFPNQKAQRDGKAPRCKSCAHEYKLRHYAKNRERILAYQSEYAKNNPEVGKRGNENYRKNHPERVANYAKVRNERNPEVNIRRRRKAKNDNPLHVLFTQTRSRARNSGIAFEIEEKHLSIPSRCPILDIPLHRTEGFRTDGTPSLYKLIPELGYIPGNVAIISHRANTLKADGTAEEHRRIAEWVEERLVSPDMSISFSDQSDDDLKRAHALTLLARKRSRTNGTLFAIKDEDVLIPKFCPVLGIRLEAGKGKLHDNSPTLDRIIPELGYVPGNVAVISWRANRIKNVGTGEEHRKVADWMDAQLELLAAYPSINQTTSAALD